MFVRRMLPLIAARGIPAWLTENVDIITVEPEAGPNGKEYPDGGIIPEGVPQSTKNNHLGEDKECQMPD